MQGTEQKEALSKEPNRLSEMAARDSKVKFTSLAHLLTEDFLKGCYRELNPQPAAGIDRVSYASYGKNLDDQLLYSLGFTLVALFLGSIIFNRVEQTFMDTV